MKPYDIKHMLDAMQEARIFAQAEWEQLCNKMKYKEALIFQAIRSNLDNSIRLLKDYDFADEKERKNDSSVKN